ncbi:DUF371 domain-containing protein [Methanobrevibacter sp.]
MNFIIHAMGHENITSKHKSTFEITTDKELSLAGDCIIGVEMDKTMNDFPKELKEKISNEKTEIKVKISTENFSDEIIGYGHPKLTLDHPTDIVCRKSNYVCSRTLMIKSDKSSSDLNRNLINDLKNSKKIKFEIII